MNAWLMGALALAPACAGAEVKFAAADGFLIEHRFTIAAPAAKVWESLQHPERWWPADHTWSGKRENLSLVADAGGCFCERWDGGVVEHGRVVLVMPGKMLRLDAALAAKLDALAPIVDQVNAQQFGGLAEAAAKP